ncbi:fumarylacetoacetate hydrolase family protein [Granulicella sibirica]|uniref:Fumarylacetoacetate hydrolase family protein n=1 Tax=Granulicella sibirica TaxID=2479048 RepID=A0A4V1L688_9BACT|nr:fumarylacetoacetate hydrolase family protein [Granulicella sibirica]RXH58414.1 Fumarylacetoacetate hydrolase family protein [Granulicella sibirica]
MKLYRTATGILVEDDNTFYTVAAESWDDLLCSPDIFEAVRKATVEPPVAFDPATALAPIAAQEVWAAGVTYFRSRNARMEESKDAGGGTFYDRVYDAPRPELFFKGAGWRAVGPGGAVRIRSDASWSVPEPELTLVINPTGKLIGYTIGNDMSSRDIEGENPLYLPQAKVYEGSCAIGPCILLAEEPISKTTVIEIEILRAGATAFTGQTTLAELKRDPLELISYLFRDNTFPQGVFLMTGTGIVPGDDFTLATGDIIRITIEFIGMLENRVS